MRGEHGDQRGNLQGIRSHGHLENTEVCPFLGNPSSVSGWPQVSFEIYWVGIASAGEEYLHTVSLPVEEL